MTVHLEPHPDGGSLVVWRDRPDAVAGLALSALTYLARVTVETGEAGYSQECMWAHGWAIREMVAAIRKAVAGDEPLTEARHVLGSGGPPMAGQSIEDATQWLRIVCEHHRFGGDPVCEITEEERAGLAVVMDIVIGHLGAAEEMRRREREASHVAE